MRKATGSDEMLSECFEVELSLTAEVLKSLRHAYGRVGATPEQWKRVSLFALFKKDDP